MKISVIGSGYVGLVTGTCLADNGNDVWCVDIDAAKIAKLNQGEVPIYEPGLDQMIKRNVAGERLKFTTDLATAVQLTRIIFICVGTPPRDDASPDMRYVYEAVEQVGRAMQEHKVIVMKSTVPVGTAAEVRRRVSKVTSHEFDVVSNPEFLKEGAAIDDFLKPDRVVVGTNDARVATLMKELYDPFVRTGNPILVMDNASAELTKYAANALLASRISFMNELANLADRVGADISQVRTGIGSDKRIGHSFLFPGIGYGGSCLAGRETVLIRQGGRTRLVRLDALFRELAPQAGDGEPAPQLARPEGLEVLSWSPETGTAEWRGVSAATRRPFEGEAVLVKTKMGRRVLVTPDHPFVVRDAQGGAQRVKLAADLGADDWLPLSPVREVEAQAGAVPPLLRTSITNDAALWRTVGSYIAVGQCTDDGRRRRLIWTFRSEQTALVEETARYWSDRGVETDVHRTIASAVVSLSDEAVVTWWTRALGLSANALDQRVPDLAWELSRAFQDALLAGLRDASGSHDGFSTPSRELADGFMRLLGDAGRTVRWTLSEPDGATVRSHRLEVSQRTAQEPPWVRVKTTARRPYRGWVYSLEVQGTETFVTTGGLVVHNCFPKDVDALVHTAREHGIGLRVLKATNEVNAAQKRVLFEKIHARFGGDLAGKRIALWGLAFKPQTDDMREAPALTLIEQLTQAGATVCAYDPVAAHTTKAMIGDKIEYAAKPYDALRQADALAIATEWNEFRRPDFERIKGLLRQPLIFDGRNIYEPAKVEALGIEYYGIGRGRKLPPASKK